METNPTYYSELLHKYFSGEAGPDEMNEVWLWISKNEENRNEFEELSKTYQLLQKKSVQAQVDVDDEWLKFKAVVSPAGTANQEIYTFKPQREARSLWLTRAVRIAAVFIILAVSGYFIYTYLNKVTEKVLTASDETIKASLPDGTKVTLNAGATISYPSKFKEAKRKVALDGEAYFEVKHDESQPFLINAGAISVEVLGTSFYVNTNAAGNNVEVKVTSGRVAVYYSDKPEDKIIMLAGDRVALSKSEINDVSSAAIMPSVSEKLEFNDQPLSTIVDCLNKMYRSNIKIESESIRNCRMTAAFENQSLDAVLNVIEATLDVRVTKNGKSVIITGEDCK